MIILDRASIPANGAVNEHRGGLDVSANRNRRLPAQREEDPMRKYLALGTALAIGAGLVGRQIRKLDRDKRRTEHISQTEASYRSAHTRILILGAGFGGLATALQLDRELRSAPDTSILVVDRNNDLLFTPLLWTVANGRANPNNVVVPIRAFQKGRRFHVLHAEVESIDLERKEVHTSDGPRPYDILIIALQLRNHLIDAVEAAHRADTPQERQEWLTFVVGGAGDTGIELAAIIHDYILTGLFGQYPWLADAPIRVLVVGRAERVLPMSDPHTSELVRRTLEQEGIEVLTGSAIQGVTETTVETSTGSIPARTLFWAAGITAPEVVRQLPVQHAHNGAILVDDHLRIPGHPEVYVIGDAAWAYDSVTHAPVAPTAQAAHQEGGYVARTIAREHTQRPGPAYRYTEIGHLALLGHYTGVAKLGPITFAGPAAWLLWHLAYLQRNPSWNKRIRLVIDWLLSGLLGRETEQLRLTPGLPQQMTVLARKPDQPV
jgi:NADH:ubiquinone reductase (H+-translocating)